jgi:hypothetical protein
MSLPQTPALTELTDDSPLVEAETESLDILFNRNPEDLSRADRVTIVEKLRAMRSKWASEEAEGKTRSSAVKKAPAAPKKTLADLLGDDNLFT